jgi:hypothetical protein
MHKVRPQSVEGLRADVEGGHGDDGSGSRGGRRRRACRAKAAQVDTFPVTWTLTSDVCPNLPAGTTVTGTGVEKSVTAMPARPGGFLVNATHAQGTATDQDGNVYVFSYSNEVRATPQSDGLFVGLMTDHFSLRAAARRR